MTIRPIPLDGLHIIKQFVAAHSLMFSDREGEEVMRRVVELENQIKHQHDDEPKLPRSPEIDICDLIPGAGDMVRRPDGSLDKATKEDRLGLQIVQLREMVKIRDGEIAKLTHRNNVMSNEWRIRADKMIEQEKELDELRAMVKSKSEQIKDMASHIWEWRALPDSRKVDELKRENAELLKRIEGMHKHVAQADRALIDIGRMAKAALPE